MFRNANGGIKKDYITGILLGVGISALGFYVYKKNQDKVDGFLESQGINIKKSNSSNFKDMDIKSLIETKEHLEDLIAEREMTEEPISSPTDCCEE